MRELILLMLVSMGVLSLVGVFVARIALRDQAADSTDIVGGLLSAIIWGVVALGANNIESQTFCCQETYSSAALAWIAVALAALSVLAMFMGTGSLVDFAGLERDERMR